MVEKPVETSGQTPPRIAPLDLDDTHKSDLVIADVEENTDELWPKATWKGFVLYAIAAGIAIMVGVIPALWINRWHGEAEADPRIEAKQAVTAEPIGDHVDMEAPAAEPASTAEIAPAPTAEAEAAAKATVATERAKPASTAKANKRRPKSQRVKQPAPRPTKPIAPSCDIYLHPHGCPR